MISYNGQDSSERQVRANLVVGVLSVGSDPRLVRISISSRLLHVGSSSSSSSTEHIVSELVFSVLGRRGRVLVISGDPSSSGGGRSILSELTLKRLEVKGSLLGRLLLLLLYECSHGDSR